MLAGTRSSGMYAICIAPKNCIAERRHILGQIYSMALYKKGSQGTLLLSRLYVGLYSRAKNIRQHNSKRCCIRFLNCNACSQNECKGFMQSETPDTICQTSDLTVRADTAMVAASNSEWNTMLLQDKDLTSAISYEAEKGYIDAQGKNMRFSDFLSSRILPLCSPLVDKPAKTLLEGVKNYARATIQCRFELLSKITLLMGFESIDAMVGHERALRESTHALLCFAVTEGGPDASISLSDSSLGCHEHEVSMAVSSVDVSSFSQACKTFPCLRLGSSPHVNLYSKTEEKSERVDHECIENNMEDESNFVAVTVPQTQSLAEDESNQADTHCEFDLEAEQCTFQIVEEGSHLSKEDKLETANKADLKEGGIMADTTVPLWKTTHNTSKRAIHVDRFLDQPIGTDHVITPSQCSRLDENGFHTVRILLQHFPRTYANFRDAQGQLENGQLLNITGRVLSSRAQMKRLALVLIEVIVECQVPETVESCSGSNGYSDKKANKRTVYLHLKKFYRGARFAHPWILKKMESNYHEGDLVSVSGKVMALERDDHFEMRDYNIDVLEGETDLEREEPSQKEKLYPIYPVRGTLDRKSIGDCIKRLLKSLPVDIDPVPDSVCVKFNLMKLHEAYFGIHCPKDLNEAESARRRFIFDDFFYRQLGLLFRRQEVVNMYIKNNGLAKNSIGHEVGSLGADKWSQLPMKVLKSLPFSLTNAQLKAASEIIWDLRRPVPMNRLLQGDVGCGKTVVALLAALETISSGYQAAFMVPTELLAVQHYENIVSILERIDEDERPSVALLTGSTPLKEAYKIRQGLENGDIALVVGTHSLIAEGVKFASLCFAVIDEQHRFGVAQRGKFSSKVYTAMDQPVGNDINFEQGELVANKAFASPHVLVMSATPIPRTLALAFYGDMSLSQINESLPGRVPVKTFTFCGNKSGFQKAYQMVQEDLDNGGRVFLVYAAIDESKQLPQLHAAAAELETISSIFKGYNCGLLHGRMKINEKETAIQQFKSGETQILLSTQLIEIGLDIPEATMMVIINAERFGMAQLHQLRGRIGRGTRQATCILLSSTSSSMERLKLLEKSTDGFYLAEADLHYRGPGNLLGMQQSGHLPEFSIARLETDGDVLEQAHIAALEVLQKHHHLDGLPKLKEELSMRHSFSTFVS